ncbi:MAG: methyltransferase domain-containing protein [Terriglobales bacterium]
MGGLVANPAELKREVRRHYDALFWPYLLLWGHHLHHGLFHRGNESPREAQVAMLRYCVSLLPEAPQRCVLDVGCGYGGTALFLAREFGCPVHGISLSPRQVEYANARARRKGLDRLATFGVADAERYEFAPGAYDLIWVMESSEHFLDRPHFFARSAESLCTGGMLLLTAWAGAEAAEQDELVQLAKASVCPAFSTQAEYRSMLNDAGLIVYRYEDLTSSVLQTWQLVRSRVRKLRPFVTFASTPVKAFSAAVDVIGEAFRRRLLTYEVCVAIRG